MPVPSLLSAKRGAPNIRKFFVTLTALIIVGAVLVAAAPAEAGVRRVAMGVWAPDGNRDFSVYNEFASDVGRRPAIWTMSVQWGNSASKNFPVTQAKLARKKGSAVMITWTPTINPMVNETGKYARFSRIAKGKHDKYIKRFARQIKKFKGPVILRFAHEINANFFPWSKGWGKFYNPATGKRTVRNDNSPKKFKKAWRRVYNLFQKVGAKNAYFAWTFAKQSCSGCNPYKKWYPGDRYVDYVGFSTFNWGGFNGRPWASFADGMKQPMKHLKSMTRKPVIVAELGSAAGTEPGQSKPQWIRKGYPEVRKKYPRVWMIIYQHVDFTGADHGHPSWSLDNPPEAMDAYSRVAKTDKFKGRLTSSGKVK